MYIQLLEETNYSVLTLESFFLLSSGLFCLPGARGKAPPAEAPSQAAHYKMSSLALFLSSVGAFFGDCNRLPRQRAEGLLRLVASSPPILPGV